MYKTRAARDGLCVVLIINETWEQMKTAYANGIGLREIARNMSLPEGAVLARAKRQGWTRQLESAKGLAKRENAVFATPVEAVAITLDPICSSVTV